MRVWACVGGVVHDNREYSVLLASVLVCGHCFIHSDTLGLVAYRYYGIIRAEWAYLEPCV